MNIRSYSEQELVHATSRFNLPYEVNACMDRWNRIANRFNARATFIPGVERPFGPLGNMTQVITVTIEGDCDDPKCKELFDAVYSTNSQRVKELLEREFSSSSKSNSRTESTTGTSPHNVNKAHAQAETQNQPAVKGRMIAVSNSNTDALLKRAFLFLEDGDWDRADEYCETVLDLDPENAGAYIGKLMVELKVRKREDLKNCKDSFENNNSYQKAVRFADAATKERLVGFITQIHARREEERLSDIYSKAQDSMNCATSEADFICAAQLFESIDTYKDAAVYSKKCRQDAEIAKKDAILQEAKEKMALNREVDYKEAIFILQSIRGWKNADELIDLCRKGISDLEVQRKAEQKEAEERVVKSKKMAKIAMAIVSLIVVLVIVINSVIIPRQRYNKAIKLLEAGLRQQAAVEFFKTGEYKDALVQAKNVLYKCGLWQSICAGASHTVALKSDGTVVAVGNNSYGECNVSYWKDIVSIASGGNNTVGLRSDGSVVAVGENKYGQCNVSEWSDIIAISAGLRHTIGLKSDGTVVAIGNNDFGQCTVSEWNDIVAISAGATHSVGLKADGTVVAAGMAEFDQCDVSRWKEIVAISAGGFFTIGLKSNGTVVAVGDNEYGQCAVSAWQNIVGISSGFYQTVGLKSDGTVVAVGNNNFGQCNVSEWNDIVAISTLSDHTLGLKANGTVLTAGHNKYGQCDVFSWPIIIVP